jgi:hypothetical protein
LGGKGIDVSRTFRIRHRKKLAAANLPVMPPSRVDFLAQEILTKKELHEAYERRQNREADYTEPQGHVREAWAVITARCKELSAA